MPERINGPTPSQYSQGQGSRPSLDLHDSTDPEVDPLAVKRMIMQTDPTDEGAVPDPHGDRVAYDQFGRPLPTLEERGYTPVVKERGIGGINDRLDPLNPKAYEDMYGKGADPNEDWRNADVSDPSRWGWEAVPPGHPDYIDPRHAVGNAEKVLGNDATAAARYGRGENAKRDQEITEIRDKGERILRRTPPRTSPLFPRNPGEPDPREV